MKWLKIGKSGKEIVSIREDYQFVKVGKICAHMSIQSINAIKSAKQKDFLNTCLKWHELELNPELYTD